MKRTRRSVLAGLAGVGATAAGIVFGTGAFTGVDAERDKLDSDLLSEATKGFNNQATVSIGALEDGDVVDGEEAFRVVNNFDRGLSVNVDVDDVQPGDDGELEVLVTDPDGETERSTTSADGLEIEPDEALLVALEFRTRDEPAEGEITFEADEIIP